LTEAGEGEIVMTRTRSNVFDLGDDWAEPILWYARGVKAMQARPLDNPTSWRFFAAIHGIWRELWDFYDITKSTDPAPSDADTETYLDQCQHQSWYFLPWHRGYLLALEDVVRREIELQDGPHDTWALPYWNYFQTGQNVLPPAFQTPAWPDGPDDNPLFVEQRWGPLSGSTPFDVASVTNLDPVGDPEFAGPGGGGNVGFGGLETGFNWQGGTSGEAENNPHNVMHGLIGGGHPTMTFQNGNPFPGLMSTPVAAALDPIFWLHHCNIDRLWESWNRFPAGKPSGSPTDWQNPVDPKWLNGPPQVGEREFALPKPDGTKWTYVPAEMQDIAALGYEYDSLEPGAEPVELRLEATRRAGLGLPVPESVEEGVPMPSQDKVEMIGASDTGLAIAGEAAARATVKTEAGQLESLRSSFTEAVSSASSPDRVFLNLENVTGLHDAVILKVYLGRAGAAEEGPGRLAGSISLFGVSQASDPEGKHAGNGINYNLEVTDIVDQLHLEDGFDVNELAVDVVPLESVPEAARIRIGRISLYRQHA
jgi:tyrosinase